MKKFAGSDFIVEAADRFWIKECKNFKFWMWINFRWGKFHDKIEFLNYQR